MKSNLRPVCLAISCCLLGLGGKSVIAATDPNLALLSQRFEDESRTLLDRTSWEKEALSNSEHGSLNDLQEIVKLISLSPESAPTLILLVDFCNNHDGYARQVLMKAIISGRKYNPSDLKFLKDVFLLSFEWKRENYPSHLRLWLTPAIFRYQIAFVVTGVLNAPEPASLNRDADRQLFLSDPKAWIEKKIP